MARPDVLTAEQRRYCMSRIRGKDTGPEVRLRLACWAMGLRYRLSSRLKGKPDLVFPGAKVVVFVDGCFWHGCPEHYQAPAARAEFWLTKLARNKARDLAVTEALHRDGWKVLRVWEHDLRSPDAVLRAADQVRAFVRKER